MIGGQAIGEREIGGTLKGIDITEVSKLIVEADKFTSTQDVEIYDLILEQTYFENTPAISLEKIIKEQSGWPVRTVDIEEILLIREANDYIYGEINTTGNLVSCLIKEGSSYNYKIIEEASLVKQLIHEGNFFESDISLSDVYVIEKIDVRNKYVVDERVQEIVGSAYIYVSARIFGEEKGFWIRAKPNDDRYGETKGSGKYAKGEEAKLEAIPYTGKIGGESETMTVEQESASSLEVGDEIKRKDGKIYVEGKEELNLKEIKVEV